MRRHRRFEILSVLFVALMGAVTLSCGDDDGVSVPQVNRTPLILEFRPPYAIVDGDTFELLVYGHNFVPESTLFWNGVERATNHVSVSEIRATILAEDIAAPEGSTSDWLASVWVRNPGPSGGTSGTAGLAVRVPRPQPTITSFSPQSAPSSNQDVILEVQGTGFHETSKVRWGPAPTGLPTTYHSPTQLTAVINAVKLRWANGPVDVSVVNPGPGGGGSNEVQFIVGSP